MKYCVCYFFLSLVALLTACSNQTSQSAGPIPLGPTPAKNSELIKTVQLEQVSGICLDINKFSKAFLALDPGLKLLRVTKNFSFESEHPAREEFKLIAAYSAFEVSRDLLSNVNPFDAYSQTDCSTVEFIGADHFSEKYTVKHSSPNSILAQTDKRKEVGFTWISPNQFALHLRYPIYDLPCTEGSGFVSVDKIFDWSEDQPLAIDLNTSPLAIDRGFLKTYADIVDYTFADLFLELSSAGDFNLLNFQRLNEMAARPIPHKYILCNQDGDSVVINASDSAPAPTPTPNPDVISVGPNLLRAYMRKRD